jgi:Flp pilus assembly protein TadG
MPAVCPELMVPMRTTQKGSSAVEFAFLVPWFVFLFVGILDLGYYSYALITAQSAARTAVLFTSSSTSASTQSTLACSYVYDQLTSNINLTTATTCTSPSPISLTTAVVTGPEGVVNSASTVTIEFTSATLIPIPGVLPANIPIVRTATMMIGR